MEKIFNKEIINKYINDKGFREYFSNHFDTNVYLVKYKQNEIIINLGDEADTLYYLLKGKCQVNAINKDGKLIVINTINPSSLVGEIELINEDSSFLVKTIEESLLFALPYDTCKKRLLSDANFLLHLCELLSEKERNQAIKLTQINSLPLENRLAAFILDNAIKDKLSLRKTIIAESLGVSYRHLEKVMKDFVLEGILKKDKFIYTILNKKKLLILAEKLDIF